MRLASTQARATAIVNQLGPRVDAVAPLPDVHFGATAKPIDATRLGGDARGALYILFGAVGLVLLVACANVAGLFLARASARRREIAVRLAIGAGRRRLVRQLLVESVMLAVMGGIGSLAVAWAGVGILSAALVGGIIDSGGTSGINTGRLQAVTLDVPVLAFTALLTIATGILFGLLPALQSTRPSLTDALASDNATSGRRVPRLVNARQALTVLEIALAVILLAGSGVLVRSFAHLVGVNPGFDPTHVLTMRVNRAPNWSRDSIGRFYDLALDAAGAGARRDCRRARRLSAAVGRLLSVRRRRSPRPPTRAARRRSPIRHSLDHTGFPSCAPNASRPRATVHVGRPT